MPLIIERLFTSFIFASLSFCIKLASPIIAWPKTSTKMATISAGIEFTGSLGDISGYNRNGSDKSYVRKKGGASKEKILNDPALSLTLQNANEFKGCGKASKAARQALLPLAHLSPPNFNLAANITKIAKFIQLASGEGSRGSRPICFSQFKQFLNGFSLNPVFPLDCVVLSPITCSINRETASATINLPDLQKGVNLFIPWEYPLFRFILHLGVLPDMVYGVNGYENMPRHLLPSACTVTTAWHYTGSIYKAENHLITLQNTELLKSEFTLLAAAGIEMGTPISDMLVSAEKKKGSAKVLLAG